MNRFRMTDEKLKIFLDKKVEEFNSPAFIADDPVSIPHLFAKRQDIEIAGFFSAVLAWGVRKTIIKNCRRLLELMDFAPHDFILQHQEKDLKRFEGFCHRTFNETDLLYFIAFLRHHYSTHKSLESAFFENESTGEGAPIEQALNRFHRYFFSLPYVSRRTVKHIASPAKKSACKRLNMYLRWMVRSDDHGVDFGLWKRVAPSALMMPVDVHVARVAKNLRLLERNLIDWKAVEELTNNLRDFDSQDPVKYDFALFGMGILEKY